MELIQRCRPSSVAASHGRPADTTSILKKLTKDVVIGSTVDAKNGDQGPRSISIVPDNSHGLLPKGDTSRLQL